MTRDELLQRIKERLQEIYGARFRGLVLYGSAARGEERPDSDIDLICLLQGAVDNEFFRINEATYPLQLESLDSGCRMFNIIPVNEDDYQRRIPLYMEARKEGIAV
ncbi:MAG: nucleotidyltransferase domain-containing protein [bacterium]